MKWIWIPLVFFNVVTVQASDVNNDDTVSTNSSLIVDYVGNMAGGIKTGSVALALFDFGLEYGFTGGIFKNTRLSTRVLKTGGHAASERLIGDAQVASNIEGHASRLFYELLLRQELGHLSVVVGIHDLNSEFMVSEFAGNFINSSFGIFPSVSLNIPVSIFPVTTFGGLVSWKGRTLGTALGVYNLNHEYADVERFSLDHHFFQHGYLVVGELRIQQDWFGGHQSMYKIGAYLKRCHHEHDHDNDYPDCITEKNRGIYLVGDQMLHRFSSGVVTNIFVQANIAPTLRNLAPTYFGAGLTLKNFPCQWLPERVGIAVGHVTLNTFENGRYIISGATETVLELTTSWDLGNHFFIQPDFQYILHPTGRFKNALVGIIRFIAEIN